MRVDEEIVAVVYWTAVAAVLWLVAPWVILLSSNSLRWFTDVTFRYWNWVLG